jgi:hypothetical protein
MASDGLLGSEEDWGADFGETYMSYQIASTSTLMNVFAEEIARHSGRVADTFDDGDRLFTRSVLPMVDEVKAKDRVQAGVALKATAELLCVYPYVFRQVCRNGAIMAFSMGARRFVRSEEQAPEEEILSVREAIGVCCAEDLFTDSVARIRSSREGKADLALTLLPHISRLGSGSSQILRAIVERFFGEGDQSRFGLMNAITSVARDRRNPDERWELEELGGGVGAKVPPSSPDDPLAERVVYREMAEVK